MQETIINQPEETGKENNREGCKVCGCFHSESATRKVYDLFREAFKIASAHGLTIELLRQGNVTRIKRVTLKNRNEEK